MILYYQVNFIYFHSFIKYVYLFQQEDYHLIVEILLFLGLVNKIKVNLLEIDRLDEIKQFDPFE